MRRENCTRIRVLQYFSCHDPYLLPNHETLPCSCFFIYRQADHLPPLAGRTAGMRDFHSSASPGTRHERTTIRASASLPWAKSSGTFDQRKHYFLEALIRGRRALTRTETKSKSRCILIASSQSCCDHAHSPPWKRLGGESQDDCVRVGSFVAKDHGGST